MRALARNNSAALRSPSAMSELPVGKMAAGISCRLPPRRELMALRPRYCGLRGGREGSGRRWRGARGGGGGLCTWSELGALREACEAAEITWMRQASPLFQLPDRRRSRPQPGSGDSLTDETFLSQTCTLRRYCDCWGKKGAAGTTWGRC